MSNAYIINSIVISCFALCIYSAENDTPACVEWCTKGALSFSKSINTNCIDFKEAITKKAVTTGIEAFKTALAHELREKKKEQQLRMRSNALVAALNKERHASVKEYLLTYLRTQEQIQFLVMHGYLDPLLKQISYAPEDFALNTPTIKASEIVPKYKRINSKTKATVSLFSILSPTLNSNCSISTPQGEKKFRLSVNADTLTCRIVDATRKSTLLNYPLDPTFHSILVGKTKLIVLTHTKETVKNVEKEVYKLNAYDHDFKNEQFLISSPNEYVHMQLSPDEKKLLFISQSESGKIKAWVTDMDYNLGFKLKLEDYTNAHINHKNVLLEGSAQWLPSSDTVFARDCHNPTKAYLWQIKAENITPLDTLKMALYAHWLEKIKRADLNKVSEETLAQVSLLTGLSKTFKFPKAYAQHIKYNNTLLLQEHNLAALV